MGKDENRPIQSSGLETREGNLITLGLAGVIGLSFLPFAHVIFVPALALLGLWVVVSAARYCYLSSTEDTRVAYGPLSRHERQVQERAICQAIRDGLVGVGDEVADGIVITPALMAKARDEALSAPADPDVK